MNAITLTALIVLLSTVGCKPKDTRVFYRSDFKTTSIVIENPSDINQALQARGGDTLFSLFPVGKRMALMPRPGIQVFNQNGEMLNELCHAHFGNDEKLVKSVEQLRNRPMRSGKNPFKLEEGKNLFDILEHEQVNGKEVLDRLPRDVDRYLLIPWKVKDTVMDPGTGIVPHEDWIKPVLIVAEESDLKFAVLWESMHLTTAQGITKEEYGHLYFDAMQAQFPKQFLEDEEADTVR